MKLTDQQEKCMECRECCEYVEIPTTMLSMEVLEYWYVRGEQFYINPKTGVFNVRIKKPCVHLTDSGCAIYDNRPFTCREFMCGYGDKEVLQGKNDVCAETRIHIEESIKKWKEKIENDLQPSEPAEDEGVPGGNEMV